MAKPASQPTSSSIAPETSPDPQRLREAIDALDRELLSLISRRGTLVKQLCEVDGRGIVGRVAAAAARIESFVATPGIASDPISAEDLASVLRHVSSVCLKSIHQMRVAYLGPMHSYTHLASIKYFGDAVVFAPVASIPAVFDAVSRSDASTGVVPIENSTDGRVVDTLGMFVRRQMQICGEVLVPIHHNLLSRTPREEITEVHSKTQALSQCRGWLASHLPQAKLVEVSSTAAAAKLAAGQHGVAAVASLEAGRAYDLDVIDASIEDNPDNVTRFAVLGREQPQRTGDDKTAILFQVNHQPGALADVMMLFKQNQLNLTWIESFPLPGAPNEYLFFVETAGHRDDDDVASCIGALATKTQRLEILGSYPRAKL